MYGNYPNDFQSPFQMPAVRQPFGSALRQGGMNIMGNNPYLQSMPQYGMEQPYFDPQQMMMKHQYANSIPLMPMYENIPPQYNQQQQPYDINAMAAMTAQFGGGGPQIQQPSYNGGHYQFPMVPLQDQPMSRNGINLQAAGSPSGFKSIKQPLYNDLNSYKSLEQPPLNQPQPFFPHKEDHISSYQVNRLRNQKAGFDIGWDKNSSPFQDTKSKATGLKTANSSNNIILNGAKDIRLEDSINRRQQAKNKLQERRQKVRAITADISNYIETTPSQIQQYPQQQYMGMPQPYGMNNMSFEQQQYIQ